MINEILRSDIELAKRLLMTGSPEAHVCAALERRGINAEAATQLIAELRKGKIVRPTHEFFPLASVQSPAVEQAPIQLAPAAQQLQPRQEPPAEQPPPVTLQSPPPMRQPTASPPPSRPTPAPAVRTGYREGRTRFLLGLTVLVFLACSVGAVVWAVHRFTRRPDRAAGASVTEAQTAGAKKPAPTLSMAADGCRLEGSLLNPEASFDVLTLLIRAPTRTNSANGQTTVYAFDREGILLYTQTNGNALSVVVDFEGQGGEAGAESRFPGQVILHKTIIPADTPRSVLAGESSLGLTNAVSGTLQGGAGGVRWTFDYTKSRRRISMLIIDWL